MVLLHGGAHPVAQLEAVALVDGLAFDVHVGPPHLDLVLYRGRAEELEELGIGRVLARREDDALARGRLDVLAGLGVAGVHRAHAIAVLLQLLGEMAEARVHQPRPDDHVPVGLEDELLVGITGHRAGIAGERLLGEVVAVRQGHEVRGDVLLDAIGNLRDRAFGVVDVGHGFEVPVEGLAAVLRPLRVDGALREIRPLFNLVVACLVDVDDILATPALHGLAAHDGEVAGADIRLLGLLERDDGRALFDGGAGGRHAGDAQPDDDDIGRNLFFHVLGSDLGRVDGARVVSIDRRVVGGGRCTGALALGRLGRAGRERPRSNGSGTCQQRSP